MKKEPVFINVSNPYFQILQKTYKYKLKIKYIVNHTPKQLSLVSL